MNVMCDHPLYILADACPIIFLSKIRRLDLIDGLFHESINIPTIVRDELLAPTLDAADELYLEDFLKTCKIIEIQSDSDIKLKSLSSVNNCILHHAFSVHADLVISDDKMLRRALNDRKISTIGTLGILIKALQASILNHREVRLFIDELIKNHNFRISIELYERVLELIKPE